MPTILHIQASPTKERSFSLRVARAFLESYLASHPKDAVKSVDVFDGTLPEFGISEVSAKYKILRGKPYTPSDAKAWEGVAATIANFTGADKYVFSSAMWNFGIPYMLKKYIDLLIQPGHTFSFSPSAGYQGLVTGKPAMLILARGGAYGPGSGAEAYDFQRPYLETVLRFIGFTNIDTILVEPTLAGGPERGEEVLKKAIGLAREKARQF